MIDDRDSVHLKTGSLLLVKRRKVADECVPKKSPVVSLLFTRAQKEVAKGNPESPRQVEHRHLLRRSRHLSSIPENVVQRSRR